MSAPTQPHDAAARRDDAASLDLLRHLDWSTLLAQFAERCPMPLARERAQSALEALQARRRGASVAVGAVESMASSGLDPFADGAKSRSRFAQLRVVEALVAHEPALGEAGDLRRALERLVPLGPSLAAAAKKESLEVVELAGVLELLEATQWVDRLHARAREGSSELETLDADATSLRLPWPIGEGSDARALLEDLRRCIELDGEGGPQISDRASPELARARAQSASVQRELTRLAESLMRRREFAEQLQDAWWTFREGRAVLPVKSGGLGPFKRSGAIIHGSSQSGQTMFVEPRELVDANNRLREVESTLRSELARIRRELSARVGGLNEMVARLEGELVALAQAMGRLSISQSWDGVEPKICGVDEAGAQIHLPRARHPQMLVAGQEVVPNDLSLPLGHALVISGPNAGGKTVALKTIGSCVLLAKAGVRIPAGEGSILPHFERIVSDVGDDQSIAANLSTFSAQVVHVEYALEAATRAPGACLVLLDEIAVGTDPEQGAALAEAMLYGLVERGATVVVTTHYERLKLLGRGEAVEGEEDVPPADPRFINAAVGFDLERLAPTFMLTVGVPGSSSALAVARRLGLDPEIVERAEAMLDDAALQVDVLLQAIAQERAALSDARAELEKDRAAVRRRSSKLDDKERRLESGAKTRKVQAWSAAAGELRALERELRARRKALRRMDASRPRGLPTPHEATHEAKAVLDREREAPAPVPGEAPHELEVGQSVLLAGIGQRGEVVAIKGNKVTVQLENLRTTVKRSELRLPADGAEGGQSRAKPKPKRGKARPVFEFRRASSERQAARHFGDDPVPVEIGLDNALRVVGERSDDACDRLEAFLAEALARDLDVVVVQHGHGSGALRKAVRERLRTLDYVRKSRGGLPREGGEAVTVIWLAD